MHKTICEISVIIKKSVIKNISTENHPIQTLTYSAFQPIATSILWISLFAEFKFPN